MLLIRICKLSSGLDANTIRQASFHPMHIKAPILYATKMPPMLEGTRLSRPETPCSSSGCLFRGHTQAPSLTTWPTAMANARLWIRLRLNSSRLMALASSVARIQATGLQTSSSPTIIHGLCRSQRISRRATTCFATRSSPYTAPRKRMAPKTTLSALTSLSQALDPCSPPVS